MSTRVIVVEDDPDQAETLTDYLSAHQYEIVSTGSCDEALSLLRGTAHHDICLLDLGLPDGEGIDLIRDIRQFSDIPILVLSGRDSELDRVLALELGADDFMPKPVKLRELLARIRSVLRRISPTASPGDLPVADTANDNTPTPAKTAGYSLEIAERRLLAPDGRILELSPVEAETLLTLVKAAGRTVSRDHIIDQRGAGSDQAYDRSVDITIARLRKKLSALGSTISIQTTRGVGYRLKADNVITHS